MGLNSSKLAKATTTAQKAVRPSPPTKSATTSGVSYTKTNEIRQDGFDPHLGHMLNKLGPVQVPKLATNFHPKDNMLRILENRGNESTDRSTEQAQSSSMTQHSSRKGNEPVELDLTTIAELIRQHHIESGSIHSLSSNLDKEDLQELETIKKSIQPDNYQYLIRHFHPIDNIKLVKNPNPNLRDEPIKMAYWSQPSQTSKPKSV
ncbi:hypothetical protein MJO28_007127 [Puccinia striiformis f. sp. tritici]|nr:hypothetical protein Pst134EA_013221 [Puccinia striiformis f. sp. tritici]KAI9622784.1 hypothetical protein H4Q26_015068 [Puccinia striiformis f. sp. tritici PST-130]KNF01944.1 hypothetical protein PSTG_04769 [Puccinia striiformis f. sp. tritici PST-78]KAH9454133.1 hypothetical protein Pst134EB_014230 [Puccinia striiformis f. sp. tritici]KAH9465332.1 hypothetical protein Pst134EA_013221 [Puccinia striiformis f. sp. tritici]KAI7951443.1 hypothetical protein MJO28_007127 [Puccinia striiformis